MELKTLIATAVVAIVLPLSSVAGDKGPKDKAGWIADKLELDQARAEQVETIITDYHEGKKDLKEQKHQQLKSVLSEEEMNQLKEMWKEKKKKHHMDKKERHMDKKEHHMDKKEGYMDKKEHMKKKDAMDSDTSS